MTTPQLWPRNLPPTPTPRDTADTVNQLMKTVGFVVEINVKQFGAKGDGVADDSSAINAAFTFLRIQQAVSPYYNSVGYTVVFPAGNYKVGTTINATGFYNILNWGIRGPGKLVGHTTGQPVLDLTDSRWYHVEDLMIYGDQTDRPSCGALVARGPFGFCDVTLWENVTFDGYFTTSCLHNFASEDSHFTKCLFTNSYSNTSAYCVTQDGANSLGVTSPYLTVATGENSFNNNTFVTCEFRHNNSGPSLYLRRTAGHKFINCYVLTVDSASVVINTAAASVTNDLTLDVHSESAGATCAVRFDGIAAPTIYGFKYRDIAPQTGGAVFLCGSGVTTVTIRNIDVQIPQFGGTPSNNLFSPAANFTVHGGRIYCGDNTYNNIASLAAFTGINETDTVGHIVARTTFRAPDGSASTPSYTFSSDLDTGAFLVGANSIGWAIGGGEFMRANSSGFVNIGPAGDPQRRLQVYNDDATNSGVTVVTRFSHTTSGTPASGIGVASEYVLETGVSVFTICAEESIVSTNVGSGTEAADKVSKLIRGGALTEAGRVKSTGTYKTPGFAVASLPTGTAGEISFATNGRKNGEGGGAGTGVLVFHDGTAWRACDTGATVAA